MPFIAGVAEPGQMRYLEATFYSLASEQKLNQKRRKGAEGRGFESHQVRLARVAKRLRRPPAERLFGGSNISKLCLNIESPSSRFSYSFLCSKYALNYIINYICRFSMKISAYFFRKIFISS